MTKTPYDIVLEPIEKWCREHYYGDFLVTISLDGFEITEFLEFDPNGFIWENDWWEGQKDVKLLGFMPIDDIHIYGSPDEDQLIQYPTAKDGGT